MRPSWPICLFWCILALRGFDADGAEGASAFADQMASNRVHRLYLESHHHWQDQTNSAQAAWQFARACFDRADFTVNDSERARFAEEGITASRRATVLEP